MLYRDVVTLRSIDESSNAAGEIVETATDKTVFANVKSVKRSEFYQAQTAGIQPELVIQVRTADYNGEQVIIYNSTTYYLIRSYITGIDLIELTVKRGVR